MGLLDDLSAAGDRQTRAVCTLAAAILCSGNLTLEEYLDEQSTKVFTKVIVMAHSLQEYVKDGTVSGKTVKEWAAENG